MKTGRHCLRALFVVAATALLSLFVHALLFEAPRAGEPREAPPGFTGVWRTGYEEPGWL